MNTLVLAVDLREGQPGRAVDFCRLHCHICITGKAKQMSHFK